MMVETPWRQLLVASGSSILHSMQCMVEQVFIADAFREDVTANKISDLNAILSHVEGMMKRLEMWLLSLRPSGALKPRPEVMLDAQ